MKIKQFAPEYERINIILPHETLSLLNRLTEKGKRSRFIEQAVKHYVSTVSQANLQTKLKEGAIKKTKRDLEIAQEWFHLENQA